jgi:hypothetical protein
VKRQMLQVGNLTIWINERAFEQSAACKLECCALQGALSVDIERATAFLMRFGLASSRRLNWTVALA